MSEIPAKIVSSPHTHSVISVDDVMRNVLIALIPGIILSTVYFGIGILINCLLASVFAVVIEAGVLALRKQEIKPVLMDGTAVVAGILFALCISPFTPWWTTLTGIAFAIIVAKHLFGGLGHNPFNPAMAGYVFVLLCFPVKMAYWPDLSGLNEDTLTTWQNIKIIFAGLPTGIDGITGATPLSDMKIELGLMTMVSEIKSGSIYGAMGGKGWEWIAIAYIAGGFWLIMNKTIRWQIPVSLIGTIFLFSLIFNIIDSDVYPSVLFHLFTGGTMLCAFFIATDPSSSPTTPKGKLIYATGVGFLIYVIRTWGSSPDGIAFAILIMNGLAPLIDYYTRPKVLGEK